MLSMFSFHLNLVSTVLHSGWSYVTLSTCYKTLLISLSPMACFVSASCLVCVELIFETVQRSHIHAHLRPFCLNLKANLKSICLFDNCTVCCMESTFFRLCCEVIVVGLTT
jgi:hypothetical protein